MNKLAVSTIIDEIGAEAICERLGVSKHSVRYARNEGRFPARWFHELERLCCERGVGCPRDAFHWACSDVSPDREVS